MAMSINNNGQIVGYAYNTVGNSLATLFDATGRGNNINLGTLGGAHSWAFSINNNGQIVGYSVNAAGNYLATLFDATGRGNNIDLGTLGGTTNQSVAMSINNNGQIVGRSYNTLGNGRATLFDSTGRGNNIDLNTLINPALGWNLIDAESINDNGWIVGYGINPDGDTHAFLLTPEPATILLLGLGAVILRKRQ
jgi:probable HAF family extracellular repeat protein